jgi:hypothetical protein
MSDPGALRVVDGLKLSSKLRAVLRPDELVQTQDGWRRRLPRWFLEVPSWQTALETDLSPHFKLWEFMIVDVREHELQRMNWPRYLPMAVPLLAGVLETLRFAVGDSLHIAANGGYRSPAHRLTRHASLHCWGTAVNLYRVGDVLLDNKTAITRYGRLAQATLPALSVQPYGPGVGQTEEHLHLDLGFTVVVP